MGNRCEVAQHAADFLAIVMFCLLFSGGRTLDR